MRLGNMYGPDATFAGVPAADLETSDMIAVAQALAGARSTAGPDRSDRPGRPSDTDYRAPTVIAQPGLRSTAPRVGLHVGDARCPRGHRADRIRWLEERCPHEKAVLERIDDQHKLLDEPDGCRLGLGGRLAVGSVAPTAVRALVEAHLRRQRQGCGPISGRRRILVLPVASAWMSPEEWAELPDTRCSPSGADKPWLALGLGPRRPHRGAARRHARRDATTSPARSGPRVGARPSTPSSPRSAGTRTASVGGARPAPVR